MNGYYEEDNIFHMRDVSFQDNYLINMNIVIHRLIYDGKSINGNTFHSLIFSNISKVLIRINYRDTDNSSFVDNTTFFMIFTLENTNYVTMRYDGDNDMMIYNYINYIELMKNLPLDIKLYLLVTNNYKSEIIKIDEILSNAVSINDKPRDNIIKY